MRLKAISLFSGVGGLDFGFEAAGFETAVALDLDPVACRVMRLNRSWPVIEGDIAGIGSGQILEKAGLAKGEADVLIGGPPCQPFSKSGYWATGDSKRLDDPRADTLACYLRVLHDTQPKAFLLENVPGLGYEGKSEGIDVLRRGVALINREIGTNYQIEVERLNAVGFGVPQSRERVFVVASRDGRRFSFPSPTHVPPDSLEAIGGKDVYRTAWDAFGDLPSELNDPDLRMTGKWADLLPTIPEGHNYLWHTDRGGGAPLFGWRRRYWNFLLKLAKDLPSWTIQAQPGPATGPFHWRNRKLSAKELCRLQTFPDGLHFDCRHSDIQKLVGNAVPSALAEALARQIVHQFLGGQLPVERLSLAPDRRTDVPSAEPVQPLPTKYRPLMGKHAEHPGTGKGHRASSRLSTATAL